MAPFHRKRPASPRPLRISDGRVEHVASGNRQPAEHIVPKGTFVRVPVRLNMNYVSSSGVIAAADPAPQTRWDMTCVYILLVFGALVVWGTMSETSRREAEEKRKQLEEQKRQAELREREERRRLEEEAREAWL